MDEIMEDHNISPGDQMTVRDNQGIDTALAIIEAESENMTSVADEFDY